MKLTHHLILTLLLLLYSDSMKSQTAWQHIEGLPCEETSSVAQDSNGFIWIGTRLGLLRYDGYNIKTYRNDMTHPYAFSSCNIQCLAPDAGERIWAGSFYGLNEFSPIIGQSAVTHFGGNDLVRTICVDSRKRRWVGTDTGLFLASDGTKTALYEAIPSDKILQIRELPEGYVVVVTKHHGLYRINPHNYCEAIEGTAHLSPTSVCQAANGGLWMGTSGQGLFLLHKGKTEKVSDLGNELVNDLLLHPQGHGLILATNRGIYSYPKQTAMPVLAELGVKSLFADKDGNVWAATDNKGVFFLKNQYTPITVKRPAFVKKTEPIVSQFSVRQLSDTLLWASFKGINAIYEAIDKTYIGTWGDGFYVTENGKVTHHYTEDNTPWLKTNSIYAFTALGGKAMLIGTWYGLYLLESDGNGRYISHIGQSNISTMHTLAANAIRQDEVWLGLVGGIAHIVGDLSNPVNAKITIYTHVNKKGIIGIEDVGHLTAQHDERGEYQMGGIYRIVKDKHGRIWACTSEPGLLLYDAEHDAFRSVSGQLGILGDNVHSLDIDKNGCFWMTTNYGILQMSINEKGQPEGLQLYTKNDGLPTDYYGSTMSCALNDSTICFLNQQNIIAIVPRELSRKQHVKTFLSDILINNKPLSFVQSVNQHFVLAHDKNNITLYLSTLSMGQEASIRYAYKLDGYDREYRQTDMGSNSISYQQLPPGRYALHFFPLSNKTDNIADEQTLTFEIQQPLWWRWWAKTGYVLLLLTVIAAVIHNITEHKRKKRQLEELKTEKQQQEKLYQKKVQFYVRVLHHFLTPLTLMSDLAHDLHHKVRPSLQASMFMLSNQTDQLLEAMNNIVDVKDDNSASEALQKAQEMTQVDRDFLCRCTESVNSHIDDPDYSHTVMMAEVGASHATLYRKLKTLTGMDATSFIRSIRMRAAYQILSANPNIRISELSERVGYNNPRYFSTCFKNEFGVTPRECIANL